MDGVEAPQEREAVEGPVEPVLGEIGQDHDLDDLERKRLACDRGAQVGEAAGLVQDQGRGREGEEGDRLDEHRAHQEIEEVLAPFDAEQALVAAMRHQPLERREHQAGQDHVEHEEVEPEEDAPALHIARGFDPPSKAAAWRWRTQ